MASAWTTPMLLGSSVNKKPGQKPAASGFEVPAARAILRKFNHLSWSDPITNFIQEPLVEGEDPGGGIEFLDAVVGGKVDRV